MLCKTGYGEEVVEECSKIVEVRIYLGDEPKQADGASFHDSDGECKSSPNRDEHVEG